MMIFDRWGELIFETRDINEAWDGTFRGEMKRPGVYVYTISAVYLDRTTDRTHGSVTLIR